MSNRLSITRKSRDRLAVSPANGVLETSVATNASSITALAARTADVVTLVNTVVAAVAAVPTAAGVAALVDVPTATEVAALVNVPTATEVAALLNVPTATEVAALVNVPTADDYKYEWKARVKVSANAPANQPFITLNVGAPNWNSESDPTGPTFNLYLNARVFTSTGLFLGNWWVSAEDATFPTIRLVNNLPVDVNAGDNIHFFVLSQNSLLIKNTLAVESRN